MGRTALPVMVAVALAAAGCESESGCPADVLAGDVECTTVEQCAERNLGGFSCIDGRCRLACVRDDDCSALLLDEGTCGLEVGQVAVCEAQVCVAGCPERACTSGQSSCERGRCAYAYEGFEQTGDAAPTLSALGWNDLGRELSNVNTFIVFEGSEGCAPDRNCGGPASAGERYALLSSQPTPEKGTAETGFSCRACACCLDCRLDPPQQAFTIQECPRQSTFAPQLLCAPTVSCDEPPPSEAIPAICRDVCEACDACSTPSTERPQNLLSTCEAQAAEHSCPACEACAGSASACQACREAKCAEPCSDLLSAECEACEAQATCGCDDCRACSVCTDARTCRESGGASERCAELEDRCDAQGNDGCFRVPVTYPRAQLTAGEQALESPPIDLSAAEAPVVLEFDYVAFNVGDRYVPGIQGQSACTWEEAEQEVRVELCAGACFDDANWTPATFVGGESATFPPASQRGNGLPFGSQSGIDWRAGRLRVEIPEALFQSEVRFRFLPRLSENSQVGIDDIFVRRIQ